MTDVYVTGLSLLAPGIHRAWNGTETLDDAPLLPSSRLTTGEQWFDASRHLAGSKYRYLNNTTRYSMAAAADCLRQAGGSGWYGSKEEQRGIIVGTAVADFVVRHEVDGQVIAGGSAAMNTVSAPNISANIAAAHVAIACCGRAFSTTMTSPLLAGFESLFLAVQALRAQRCEAVLAIAAEEALPAPDSLAELPGAVVVQLQAGQQQGRRIAACAWAYQPAGKQHASASTQRFVDGLAALSGRSQAQLQLAFLRDASASAEATAACWRNWLAHGGIQPGQKTERVFAGQGAVEPMLWAAHWLTLDRPAVLIAIQQRRYLAFLLTR